MVKRKDNNNKITKPKRRLEKAAKTYLDNVIPVYKVQRCSRAEKTNRLAMNAAFAIFDKAINTHSDQFCEVCTKRCYPNQIVNTRPNAAAAVYLPQKLSIKSTLQLCYRCKTHITSRKTTAPPKAYWNSLDPGEIPPIIQELTEPERRLLSRIIPFLKIIKFTGTFGQYGFKGQAILFAQDITEVTNKLSKMLPRAADNTDFIVITEKLEHKSRLREYAISRTRVYEALSWLVKNNPLYKDVIIDHEVLIDEIHFKEQKVEKRVPSEIYAANLEVNENPYKPIGELSRIIHAAWHQGNARIFTSGYAGIQCSAMVLANIVRASILSPRGWSMNTLNENMIEGDRMYNNIRLKTADNENAFPIQEDGYLSIRNFDVVKNNFIMFETIFELQYDESSTIYGSIVQAAIGMSLSEALPALFRYHNAGILIAAGKSFGLMYYDDKFYFTDSHSCGAKGASAANGRACVIQCDAIEELYRVCKRATGSRKIHFNINYIDVIKQNMETECPQYQHDIHPLEEAPQVSMPQTHALPDAVMLPVQTSLMAPIDCVQPDVEEELDVSINVNEIKRKTSNNIVNEQHELKAEEFAWFYLFPNGVNGLKETRREIPITPLDYFQYRLLGSDTRFQKNDFLFYALSTFEYHRVKSTISSCVKKLEGQEGQIEDIHLYVKNLRGSAAYWRTALNELIAQIRYLGPPTYFVTFSCNDLNWLDMKRALLIADGRHDEDPTALDTLAVQKLIEKHPVTVSRHFMIRVNALMLFIKQNQQVFGGRVIDFWWRIEFQNRGSPHLHMVLWIENHPSFETPEGIQQLDRVCSCEMPSVDSDMYELVKKCQVHRHTSTCRKNNVLVTCRFSFPRQASEHTRIVNHSSDEFIKNGGRICNLKRRTTETWVNNYNPILLKLWQGNMDIQPCGTNEAIAYYIAKYMSKSEPVELESNIRNAIKLIQCEETNLSRKLFKICMRIMRERQVSACECAFRLCHLNLRDSSRKCVFLNTRKPTQRYRVLKFNESGNAIGYCSNIFDRYEKRPNEHPEFDFNNMTLIEFAMRFEPYYAKKTISSEENVDEQAYEDHQAYEDQPAGARRRLLSLNDNSKMVIRSNMAVVRVPYFTAATDPENYYYSLLIQYMPYRNEAELQGEYKTIQEAFLARERTLKLANAHMELLRERDRQLELAFNQVHAFNILEEESQLPNEEPANEITEQPMTDQQFSVAKRAMNVGQRDIFNHITRSVQKQINGCQDRLFHFITGNAGTGKTFLFNIIKNQVNRCYQKRATKVCALTGVAARLIGGSTLHSVLRLPVQKDGRIVQLPMLTGHYLRIMRLEWKNVEFMFIDEISMVPYEMLCMINSRLQQLKNNDQIFGGINVLIFGDLMQLPPVRGNQVFHQPLRLQPATHLWKLFTLVELKENMRQQGSLTFIDILNALRIGEMTSEHMSVLLSKVSKETTGEFSIEKALRIYPTNEQVDSHNKLVLGHFRVKGTKMFEIKAQDQLVKALNKSDKNIEKVLPDDINKTGGLPRALVIFVGAKIMLRSNIDVPKGLVNGAIGIITEVIWPYFRRDQLYETDIPSVQVDFGRDGIHTIVPRTVQFPAKYNSGTIERRMLPMVLSWASTVHKMQGCTVDYAVVYLGKKLFAKGQAYVALSRVKSLDGLQIEELDLAKLTGKVPCNIEALAEMQRMRTYRPE